MATAGAVGAATAGAALGSTVASLPPQATPVAVNGTSYYSANGAYYAPSPKGSGYTVVQPPAGAVVPAVPASAKTVTTVSGTNNQSYAYHNGAFYQPADNGYRVVSPPPGVMVHELPPGAMAITVGTTKYFEFGGVWYQPFYNGSEVVYLTVPNPTMPNATSR